MKTIVLVLLLIAVGGAAWLYRDSLPFFDREPVAEFSEEEAAVAAEKIERMRDEGETARLSSAELTSLLRFRTPAWANNTVGEPEVRMNGDTMRLSGTIPTDRLPSHPELDRVRGMLPDSAKLEVQGGVRSLGDGRAALHLREVEFAGIPIPERYYPQILERLGRLEESGLRPEEMALPLPPGVSEARVENGLLILIP